MKTIKITKEQLGFLKELKNDLIKWRNKQIKQLSKLINEYFKLPIEKRRCVLVDDEKQCLVNKNQIGEFMSVSIFNLDKILGKMELLNQLTHFLIVEGYLEEK